MIANLSPDTLVAFMVLFPLFLISLGVVAVIMAIREGRDQ